MQKIKLLLTVEDQDNILIQFKQDRIVCDQLGLTIGRDFDRLLMTVLDKLLAKHRITKLSLKSLKIRGKIRSETVSGMILKTIKAGLGT